MNVETRVIIVHTTSLVDNRGHFHELIACFRTLASLIVKQASAMGLTGGEYMWIMSSIVLCKSAKDDG